MKLIDADKLIEELNKNSIFRTVTNAEGKSAIEIIEEQPTAFDVDKVCEELEGLVEDREEDIINDEYTFGECSAYESAIRVVKAGGIDEKN